MMRGPQPVAAGRGQRAQHTTLPEVRRGPRTVEEARLEVQRSRARVEATLDQLEEQVVETRAKIRGKLDFARPVVDFVREKPLVAVGAAVAVGLFIGTRGGDDDEDEEEDALGFDRDERRALEEWRVRRRKMLWSEAEDAADAFEEDEEDVAPSRTSRFFRAMGHETLGVILGIVGAEVAERMYGARAAGDDRFALDDDDTP